MSRSLKQWKEAASLIVTARNGRSAQPAQHKLCDYQVLLLKRQRNTVFASAHVFPGGVMDPSDFSPKWLDIFRHVGITGCSDFGLPDLHDKPRPWPVKVERDRGLLPSDIAFRICALRETFEESGILLLSDVAKGSRCSTDANHAMASCYHGNMSRSELSEWQKAVHKDGFSFLDLCSELQAVPDVWSLKEWYHILTPQNLKKRYDTMFYLCTMDSRPNVHIDDVEMVQTEWGSPSDILERFWRDDINFELPQFLQATILLKFPVLQELHEYAVKRQQLGLDDVMPVLFQTQDGTLVTMPGDDLYPSDVTYDTNPSAIRQLKETISEAKGRSRNRFRFSLLDLNKVSSLECNIELPCGMPSPDSVQNSPEN